jgi:N-acetylmuramoyl-L-alanine amidase
MKRQRTSNIVIHCSATRGIQDIGAREIRKWHVEGNGWADIGYHFVIRRSGRVEAGRPVDNVGSHVQGQNATSVGVCLVGGLNDKTFKPENNFTPQQWVSLKKLVSDLAKKYPKAKVLGHRDFPGVQKACPCFAAKAWAKKEGFPV